VIRSRSIGVVENTFSSVKGVRIYVDRIYVHVLRSTDVGVHGFSTLGGKKKSPSMDGSCVCTHARE
jgi:hypothetical protein